MELKHKWEIDEDSWYIRLYLWAWKTNKNNITFCKLFWGYVFLWLILLLHLIAAPFILVGGLLEPWAAARRAKKPKPTFEPKPPKVKEGPSVPARILDWISTKAAAVGLKVQSFWYDHQNVLFKIVTVLSVVVGTAVVGILGWLFVENITWGILLKAVIVVGITIGILAVVIGLIFAIDKLATPTKRVGLTFRQAMKQGYVAVKTNTCPQVILIEKDDNGNS